MSCGHANFAADVQVARLSDYDNGPITGYTADVRLSCDDCGEPFEFIGLPIGWLASEPAVSVDGREARMPVRPTTAPEGFGEHLTGFTVRAT